MNSEQSRGDFRDRAVEAMAAAMRPTLGGDWVKFQGGEGIASLALDALLPIIVKALDDREPEARVNSNSYEDGILRGWQFATRFIQKELAQ